MDKNSLADQIKETESKIRNTELDLGRLKDRLEFLRQEYADSFVIPWRSDIENCLRGVGGQPIFTSYEVVLNNIETKYDIIASRKVEHNVITTLSAMFKDRIIGRIEHNNIYYYGVKGLFLEEDLSAVKPEFLSLFEKCRDYVENFEKEI